MCYLSMRCGIAVALASLVMPLAAARAETRVSLRVAKAPDYLGSDDYEAVPLPGFSFTIGRMGVESNGLGIEADLAPFVGASSALRFGPILRYDLGRNDGSKVKDRVVARTAPVEAAPEIGGFVEVALPLGNGGLLGTARVSVVQGTGDGHGGTLAEGSIGVLRAAGAWTLGAQVTASWASEEYQDAYFGVSAADAAATGLAPYALKGGLRDAGVSGFASYAVNDRLSVDLIAGYTRLASDPAASPLVAQRGKRDQAFAGIGLTYTFR